MSSGLREQLLSTLGLAYTLHHELGHGGMAVVYLATDLRHHRLVALKALQPESATEQGAVRFHREVETAAGLSHPHILPVFDSGEANGLLWYAMPYVEGESLRDRLRREKLLPIDQALCIAREVADALAYAHRRGVVHRDVKPENVLLQHGHALVADFGIARAIAAAPDPLTITGVTLGTPAYMSPESASGERELDGRSDVYSLGCILYEMLAGEPPFTGPTPQAVLAKRMKQPAPPVSTLRETVPEAVDYALVRALARVPADRFATAEQFAQALNVPDMMGGGRERAAPTRRRATEGRHWRVRLAAAGASLLLAAAAAAWRVPGAPVAEAAPSPTRTMIVVLPFKNLGRPEDGYFADGVTEEIASRLASRQGLGIISRTTSDRYRNSTKPLRELARELRVEYVLEGGVRWDRPGARHVRVTPELIRVSDDSQLWAQRYDADADSVLAAQGRIAEEVTEAVIATLRGPSRSTRIGAAIGGPPRLTSLWADLVHGRPRRRVPMGPRIEHEAAGRVGSALVAGPLSGASALEREGHFDGRQERNQRLLEQPDRLDSTPGRGEQPRPDEAVEVALRAQRIGQRE
jgi:serine/threonine-protein kinase